MKNTSGFAGGGGGGGGGAGHTGVNGTCFNIISTADLIFIAGVATGLPLYRLGVAPIGGYCLCGGTTTGVFLFDG